VEATGEALAATGDPVSLMEELHRSLNIKLHAIGISDKASFLRWWSQTHRASQGEPHVSAIPNHDLLEELVNVGGGDPGRVGGLDVLEGYFSGLGAGVSHRVGKPVLAELPQLQARLTALTIPRRRVDPATAILRQELADRAQRLRTNCIRLSVRCARSRCTGNLTARMRSSGSPATPLTRTPSSHGSATPGRHSKSRWRSGFARRVNGPTA